MCSEERVYRIRRAYRDKPFMTWQKAGAVMKALLASVLGQGWSALDVTPTAPAAALSLSLSKWAEQCTSGLRRESEERKKTGTENKCWLAPFFPCLHEKGICWICHGYILLSPAARTAPRKTHLLHLFLRASPCFLSRGHTHTGLQVLANLDHSVCTTMQCTVLISTS